MHFRFDFSSGKLLKIRCLVKTHVAAAAAKLGVVVVAPRCQPPYCSNSTAGEARDRWAGVEHVREQGGGGAHHARPQDLPRHGARGRCWAGGTWYGRGGIRTPGRTWLSNTAPTHDFKRKTWRNPKTITLKRNAQVFPEHTESETRYTRSLYYGVLPATDRPSLPLTRQDLCINVLSPWMHWWSHPRSIECFNIITKLFRLAVDQFTSSGLDALGQKLGRLDMARAADISRQACAGETFH